MKQLIWIIAIFLSALSIDQCSGHVEEKVKNYDKVLDEWVIITDHQGEPQLVRRPTLELIERR